ncbi:hypothetical protein evm_006869 [Chilo suppressalis]|nr:hypothetical protein evm_006869 [Chilo suppressalis]
MDAGFVKTESTNLPRIDALMVGEFVALNPDFCSAEQRNDKASINTESTWKTMAKRSNPFTEDFLPQSKIHVGLKQFNNNEVRLEKVYEKTLELLFKGAKKAPVLQSNNAIAAPSCRDKMKQLFIGKNGNLSHSGTVVENRCSVVKQCSCGESSVLACAYCDRVMCAQCQHHCTQCNQSYCFLCSLLGTDGSEVCVSCYG